MLQRSHAGLAQHFPLCYKASAWSREFQT